MGMNTGDRFPVLKQKLRGDSILPLNFNPNRRICRNNVKTVKNIHNS